MTLREFIRREIREGHVFGIEEFGTKVPRGCDKWDAYHREIERRELEDEIKQCDLNMLAMSKDKIEPDDEFRAVYIQRCEMLKQYRMKYGQEAEHQLRDQLDEARKAYVKQTSDQRWITKKMTLDEAIEHLEDSIKNKEFSCESCKEEHKQLLEWLKELRNLKEKKNG